ncbi:glycosyltransferase family 15 protein [Conidiobolus coronatus NRRL 28638]|uniref:Glycosyltransferase family 15 protein n=1 Tax=Conidiobolus coronatus (strain ATCC 28846 / CBS 209.66 / NRRL 28638) TaxID=796925 RepID=A0A137PB46_CONC2|nr:glycosyltransferase family 15 protein [Conidiobolus coronatus NRRL 28638]|eukprot:KXN72196.1 glycosyltransferase family 15 protein [Conidiobolus coronatus NRRL 28638]
MAKLKLRVDKLFSRKLTTLLIISILILLTSYQLKPISNTTTNKLINISTNTRLKATQEVTEFDKNYIKQKATFVILVRNSELTGWLSSMRSLEDRLIFKTAVRSHTKAEVKFGLIPQSHWGLPSWIDRQKFDKVLKEAKYMYGDSESYRYMCRYESGFFYKHPLLTEYDYYWRVEPDIQFYCDINYDPFKFFHENNLKYGFTITMTEEMETVETLMETVDSYLNSEDIHKLLPKDNSESFVRSRGGGYNGCHYWTNFEIASFSIWRSPKYQEFFDRLDKSGGFFYERWGDAPIHTLYLSLFHSSKDIHFFEDIGYEHTERVHCPLDQSYFKNNCNCDKSRNHDFQDRSCLINYLKTKTNANRNANILDYLK